MDQYSKNASPGLDNLTITKSNTCAGDRSTSDLNSDNEDNFSKDQKFIKQISRFEEESKIVIVEQKSDQVIPVKVYREAVIPMNINRHVLLVIVILYVILVGTHFLNWTRWASILTRNHAFSEECVNSSEPCSEQKVAINSLLLLTTLTMFTFTFLAGLLLDLIGPKICSLFGLTLLIVAWSLLIQKLPSGGVYKTGFALLGAGSDPAFFGTLSISNLFPGYSSTVISVFGAARSVSNVWPVLLELIASRHPSYTLTFMAITFCSVYVICVIVVLLFIPMRAYVLASPSPAVSPTATGRASVSGPLETDLSKSATLTHYRKMTKMVLLSEDSICLEPYSALPVSTEVVYADQILSNASDSFDTLSNKGETSHAPLRTLQSDSVLFPSCSQKHVPCCTLQPSSSISYMDDPLMPENIARRSSKFAAKESKDRLAATWKFFSVQVLVFAKHFKNPKYLPIVILCAFNIIRNNYFLTTAQAQLGPAEAYLALLNILAFIPGPICGYLVDRYGPLTVIAGINCTNTAMFIVLFCAEFAVNVTLKRILQYTAVTLAFPGIGYLLSQVYCYIAVNFPTEDLGKLAGFASCVSGICGLVVSPMIYYNEKNNVFWHMNLVNIFISLAGFGCIFFVYYFSRRESIAAASAAKTMPTLDVDNASSKKIVVKELTE